jgi:hypothetical protein
MPSEKSFFLEYRACIITVTCYIDSGHYRGLVPSIVVEKRKLLLAGTKRYDGESRCNHQIDGAELQS